MNEEDWRLERVFFETPTRVHRHFQIACEYNSIRSLHYLVDVKGVALADARIAENYAFRWAARNGHVDVLQFLVERLGLDAEDARAGDNYAFQWAAKNGHVNVLRFLVERLGLNVEETLV
jgi:ankyrin repeat protein